MATMIPLLTQERLKELGSRAEAKVYEALRTQLPSDCTVLFEVPWIGTAAKGNHFDGECDFIIMRPGWGLLIVEVKGGGIKFNTNIGVWSSVDRHGNEHEIKDPFRQATKQKHEILRYLNQNTDWKKLQRGKIIAGHAVLFPDINANLVVGPQAPQQIVAGRSELRSLEQWLVGVNAFWAAGVGIADFLRSELIKIAAGLLSGQAFALPLVSVQLEREEQMRIELTSQQGRVLRAIGKKPRAKICGGAGTGKTVLAVERARELAQEGLSTLLLCYNQLLSQQMTISCKGINGLHVMTFHQMCGWYSNLASQECGTDVMAEARAICASQGHVNQFEYVSPLALYLATMKCKFRFDAIIIDEGQDFQERFWVGVEALLRDPDKSRLYVFLDQNQAIYEAAEKIPVPDDPFLLTFNCRNTETIHKFAYKYYRGEPTDPPPGMAGVPIGTITQDSLEEQMVAIRNEVTRLIVEEGVKPKSIAVLICGQPKENYYPLAKKVLPNGLQWSLEGDIGSGGVRIDTVRRFKGLEADYVFLWGLDSMKYSDREEVIYVGSTRAKSRLVLVGRPATVQAELEVI